MHETNARLASLLEEVANLLTYQGENRFKVVAYLRGAKTLRELPEPIEVYAQRGELESLPGVGEALAEKIRNYLETGTFRLYERLKTEVPEGIRALIQSGLSPSTVRLLEKEHGITSPEALTEAIRSKQLPLETLPKRVATELRHASMVDG